MDNIDKLVKRIGENYKPRDPARIPIILKEIEEEWSKYPQLRLMQLLFIKINQHPDTLLKDMFYVEDEELMKALKNE